MSSFYWDFKPFCAFYKKLEVHLRNVDHMNVCVPNLPNFRKVVYFKVLNFNATAFHLSELREGTHLPNAYSKSNKTSYPTSPYRPIFLFRFIP